ncbi:hypothetical protein EMCRGX_G023894 [Ephydatia muelleri]
MAAAGHLSGGRLNLTLLREAARDELKAVLGDEKQKKVIVWDESLIKPVGLIAEVQFLKQLGVYKMVRLPVSNLAEAYPEANEYLFFTKAKISMVEQIVQSIRESTARKQQTAKKFTVVFVPYATQHCIDKFEEYKMTNGMKLPTLEFAITEYRLETLPVDSDVISLDLSSAFTDLYLQSDPTVVHQAARAIGKLQTVFGLYPKIVGKGKYAKDVATILSRMHSEMMANPSFAQSLKELTPQIDMVVLLDRTVDLLTPLCTQLTYEGLIDELYGITYGASKFPRETFSEDVQNIRKGDPPTQGPLTVMLTSEEELYGKLRDFNFRKVGKYLSSEAKRIKEIYDERKKAETVSDLKQFVQKLPHIQATKLSLSRHTTIAELIKNTTDRDDFLNMLHGEQCLREEESSDKVLDYTEQCMGMCEPVSKILRLMCMQSVANGGLKSRLMEQYKREILQCYGYQHLISLCNLEKAGLLRLQEGKSTFPLLRRQLRLIPEQIDELNPKDISYVFSGYAPLSVRLVETLEQSGYQAFEECFARDLTFQVTQDSSQAQRKKRLPTSDRPQVVLVFFLGGCTYAEISALRFLSEKEDAVTEYIVGTTHITNGQAMVDSILSETPLFVPTHLWNSPGGDEPMSKVTASERGSL